MNRNIILHLCINVIVLGTPKMSNWLAWGAERDIHKPYLNQTRLKIVLKIKCKTEEPDSLLTEGELAHDKNLHNGLLIQAKGFP